MTLKGVASSPSSTTVFARKEVLRLTSIIKHTNWKTRDTVSSICNEMLDDAKNKNHVTINKINIACLSGPDTYGKRVRLLSSHDPPPLPLPFLAELNPNWGATLFS